jgi:DNA polymerase-3 subunit delta'
MSGSSIFHQSLLNQLQNAFANNTQAHAYLLWGNEGLGKKALIYHFLKVYFCLQSDTDPCGNCAACHKILSLNHPDIHFLFPVKQKRIGKKSQADPDIKKHKQSEFLENPFASFTDQDNAIISIEDIRQMISEASYAPIEGRQKFFLIFNIETMRGEATNALLKTLEEPPEYVQFFLTSSNMEAILPTIRSRCQNIRMPVLTDAALKAILQQQGGTANLPQIEEVIKIAQGNYLSAAELLQENIRELQSLTIEFLRQAFRADAIEINKLSKQISDLRSENKIPLFFRLATQWFRDIYLVNFDPEWQKKISYLHFAENLEKFNQRFSGLNVEKCIEIVEEYQHYYQHKVNLNLVLTNLSIALGREMRTLVQRERHA